MDYDVIIIGAGSAGLPAGMYASRYKMKNLIIGAQTGGALATSHKVENWPGVLSESGAKIMDDFKKHAEAAGSELLMDTVSRIEKKEGGFEIHTSSKVFHSRFVILATGNTYKKLWVQGEEEFLGRGVSYCATCDGMFFRDREIVVVGGGNTALTEALYLSEIAKKVTIIHRRETFKAEAIWVDQVQKHENIVLCMNEEIDHLEGEFFLERIVLKSWNIIPADGIFIAVGTDPSTKLVADMGVKIDRDGCIVVDARQETSISWLYAAWDVTTNSNKFRQTIMSAAEGCLAANSIHEDMLRKAM